MSNRNRKVEIELHWLEALALENHLLELGGGQTIEAYVHGLIQDRVEQLVSPGVPTESRLPQAPMPTPTGLGAAKPLPSVTAVSQPGPQRSVLLPRLDSIAATALGVDADGSATSASSFEMDRELPLGGLTNRIYPCFWVFQMLTEHTSDAPIRLSDFEQALRAVAYAKTEQLVLLQQAIEAKVNDRLPRGKKLTALFPSARYLVEDAPEAKKLNSLNNFVTNAFGAVRMTPGGVEAVGPLMLWDLVGPTRGSDSTDPFIAPTVHGLELLRSLTGMSADYPHGVECAKAFLNYTRIHAPGDFRWMMTTLDLVSAQPDRSNFQRSFLRYGLAEPKYERMRRNDWVLSHNGVPVKPVASRGKRRRFVELAADEAPVPSTSCISVADGYIARARELGLVEANLVRGSYWLTLAGAELQKYFKSV